MGRITVGLLVASVAAAACGGEAAGPGTGSRASADLTGDTLASVYRLATVNGEALPCCTRQTPDGKPEQLAYGVIRRHGSAYTWTAGLQIHWDPDSLTSKTVVVDSLLTSGTYIRHGATIALFDSAADATDTGSVTSDSLSIVRQGNTYWFSAVPSLSLFESRWPEGWCNGALPGCAQADSAGVVSTVIAGMLQFDEGVLPGHYLWGRTYKYVHPDGAIDTARVVFSKGTYVLKGTALTLTDSGYGRGTMTGHFDGSLTVQAGSELVKFLHLVNLPG